VEKKYRTGTHKDFEGITEKIFKPKDKLKIKKEKPIKKDYCEECGKYAEIISIGRCKDCLNWGNL